LNTSGLKPVVPSATERSVAFFIVWPVAKLHAHPNAAILATSIGACQMETKTISTADALLLSTRQEDHFFDRKAAAIKGAKLQKIAVAFANADGGEAYVGITDEKDEPDPSKRWAGA